MSKFQVSKASMNYPEVSKVLFTMAGELCGSKEVTRTENGMVYQMKMSAFKTVLEHIGLKLKHADFIDVWRSMDDDFSGTISLDEVATFLEEHDRYRG